MKALTLSFLLHAGLVCAQEPKIHPDQERALRVFANEYVRTSFPRYPLAIQVAGNEVRYDSMTIVVSVAAEYRALFTSGVFQPAVLAGGRAFVGFRPRGDSTGFYNTRRTTVSDLASLPGALPDSLRRYTFLSWSPGFANPTLYVLELSNPKGKRGESFESFLKGAQVTFCRFVSILI
ncbi:hypothetical protein EPD60_08400 [Flaviaesturariibacter flavus]|uniref:Uncharacterized protein n=1 Tax=Flaviaesturariibacter flavus TaxID=2502780 RepID=A0A4R1BAN4_9BACT|nr:hypothetical protein [Flaviaesturariibacter flavus]TCJ14025.1 hypothetical protein EPD60_08400 [Flaviaesturariibacter flavus]